MSTQHRTAALAVLALGCSLTPHASAALWSSTNTVARTNETATMEISFTGDQVTMGAQVDVTIPSGLTAIRFAPLNGAACNYISASRVVRVLVLDVAANPLPAWARPACTIQYDVKRFSSAWFPMGNAVCVKPDTTLATCALDEGYLTVTR